MFPKGCKAIIDTGTYLIYAPESKILKILQKIN